MSASQTDLQKNVVVAVARSVQADWERIIASYEIDQEDGRVEDLIVVYVTSDSGKLKSTSLEGAPNSINQAFFALHEGSSGPDGEHWTSAEVTIDADGAYKFGFAYEPPKRINGVFDHDSYKKFNDYAAIYAAEKSGT